MKNNKKFIKVATLTLAITSIISAATVQAEMRPAESTSTPTIKGYAPYLKSVGSRFVGKQPGDDRAVYIGDIIEVPTDAFMGEDSDFYTYRDGNATDTDSSFEGDDEYKNNPPKGLPPYLKSQDLDGDNETRNRLGQFLGQKVSVKWYIVEAKTDKKWADDIFKALNPTGDFLTFDVSNLGTGDYADAVISWDDVEATALTEETYYVPMDNDSRKSLALRVPPEAGNKRIGFIIVPESQTGDPARGNPLKVPDLNFFWKQNPNTKPGDVCEVNPDQELKDECNTNPGEPSGPNPDNGGGFVKIRQYMINIRWSQDGSGVPKFDTAGRPIDPIVGTSAAPYPYVNEVYYPEIAILAAQGDDNVDPTAPSTFSLPVSSKDFRILTNTEKDTIVWELTAFDLDEDPTSPNFGQPTSTSQTAVLAWGNAQDKASAKFIDLTCDQTVIDAINAGAPFITTSDGTGALGELNTTTGKPTTQCNPYSGHAFKTQLNNVDAVSFWAGASTNFDMNLTQEKSEQRMSIKVKFEYDDTGLTNTNPAP